MKDALSVLVAFAFLSAFSLALFPSAHAVVERQSVDVVLHSNGVAEERITLAIRSDAAYGAIDYRVDRQPLAVLSDKGYSEETLTDGVLITLNQSLVPGENNVSFTLLFDGLVTQQGSSRAFALRLRPVDNATLDVNVTLPEGFVLARTDAAVSPTPDAIVTDGRAITLRWHEEGVSELPIIVLYDGPSFPWLAVAIGVLLFVALAVLGVVWRRRHAVEKKALLGALGEDETLIVSLVKRGIDRQKALCAETGFSKSKMSKVVRKLEEKGVVRKEPFYKTNRLKLLPGWE